jgi:hypothetical protein
MNLSGLYNHNLLFPGLWDRDVECDMGGWVAINPLGTDTPNPGQTIATSAISARVGEYRSVLLSGYVDFWLGLTEGNKWCPKEDSNLQGREATRT